MATDTMDTPTFPDLTGLTGGTTGANLANVPNLDSLTQLVNQINQKSWLSAPGRQQELSNAQNLLAGNLDPNWVAEQQNRAAAQFGGAGFGVDSAAWNAALQRAMGIQKQDLEAQGGKALEALYSGMPTFDPITQLLTPAQSIAYQENIRQQQLEAQKLAQQQKQFEADLAFRQGQSQLDYANRQAELYAKLYGGMQNYPTPAAYAGYTGANWGKNNPWSVIDQVQALSGHM